MQTLFPIACNQNQDTATQTLISHAKLSVTNLFSDISIKPERCCKHTVNRQSLYGPLHHKLDDKAPLSKVKSIGPPVYATAERQNKE